VPRSAPRIAWPLVEAIPRLDDPGLPIAETWRRLCLVAERMGLPRPSYEQTRQLVHRSRRIRALPTTDGPLLDVLTRAASPTAAFLAIVERSSDIEGAKATVRAERAWRPDGSS
jgi:hypothetical protein